MLILSLLNLSLPVLSFPPVPNLSADLRSREWSCEIQRASGHHRQGEQRWEKLESLESKLESLDSKLESELQSELESKLESLESELEFKLESNLESLESKLESCHDDYGTIHVSITEES